MTVGTFNAPKRSNCQAKVVHTGTTQDTNSVGGTLLAEIVSNVDCLFFKVAVVEWTKSIIHYSIALSIIKSCTHPDSVTGLSFSH